MIKWIIGMSIIMVASFLLVSVMTEGDLEDAISGPDSAFGTVVTGWEYLSSGNIIEMAQGLIILPVGVIVALSQILFFNPQFWSGPWLIVKFLFIYPIGVGIVVGLILQLRGGSG